MKKLTFILALAAFASFSSCSKEKTCECTTTVKVEGQDPVTTTAETTTKDKCSDGNTETTTNGATTTVTCKEK